MIIKLNEAEKKLTVYVAKKRTMHDREKGARPTVYGNQTHEQMEINSVGAEIAFCKYMNVYPDLNTDHFGTEDAILKNGFRVDVKNTRYKNGRLMVKAINRDKCEVYALLIGEFPVYKFAGFATKEELFREENLNTNYDHPAYCMDQGQLRA